MGTYVLLSPPFVSHAARGDAVGNASETHFSRGLSSDDQLIGDRPHKQPPADKWVAWAVIESRLNSARMRCKTRAVTGLRMLPSVLTDPISRYAHMRTNREVGQLRRRPRNAAPGPIFWVAVGPLSASLTRLDVSVATRLKGRKPFLEKTEIASCGGSSPLALVTA